MFLHRSTLILVAAALGAAACSDTPVEPASQAPLTPSAGAFARAAAPGQTTGNTLVVFKGNSIPRGFSDRIATLGGEVVSAYSVVGAMLIRGVDDAGLAELGADRKVAYVEPEPAIPMEKPASMATPEPADVTASPTDPASAYFFARQWNMRAIHADQAWAAGDLGSEDVTVAILDSGIDYLYPDLQGHVDLDRSISLRPEDDALVQEYFPTRNLITDIGYHGTHVAATVVSNAVVAAGVTSRTTLFGVKVCSVVTGYCSYLFDAIQYAVDNGADIINMSLGGGFTRKDYPGYVSVINRYFNYAFTHGTLIVVSAGNDALDMDHDGNHYATYCDAPNVVCVSATGPTNYTTTGPWENVDAPASYTNYGRGAVSVAAPGGNASYVYAACSQTSLAIPVCRTGNYIVGLTGTSMAAPHVSGLAALLVAKMGHGHPAQIRAALQRTADDLGQPGTDPFYGRGRINVARAMGLD